MVPDATISGASIAKRIGKEVWEWDVGDVRQWFVELGLGAYEESIHSRGITGRELLDLQKSDFEVCKKLEPSVIGQAMMRNP